MTTTIKSTSQVIKNYKSYARLIKGVIENLNYDPETEKDEFESTISDIIQFGINNGYGKFVYYNDTVDFFKKYRSEIITLVKEQAAEFGQNPIELVLSFNCINDDEFENVAKCLYGRLDDDCTYVANGLTWFAAETVCRWFGE